MKFIFALSLFLIFNSQVHAQGCVAPTVSGTVICTGETATLIIIAPGGNYQWYDAISGGNLLASEASFTTPALTQPTTYFVQTTNGSCTSLRTAVTVTLRPNPTASGVTICAGNAATLTAVAPGGNYEWFDSLTGGNLLQAGMYLTPLH